MKVNQIKIGAILSYITIIISNVIALVYTPIMLRFVGQSEYGLYSLISSIIGYLTVLDLGFGNAIIVYTARYKVLGEKEKEKKLHGMFLIIYVIIGLFATIIGFILYLNINNMFGNTMNAYEIETAKKLMIILIINLVFTFPLSVFSSIITAYEKFVFLKIINIIRLVITPLIMIPLLFLGYKSIAMVLVTTVLNLLMLGINTLYCIKKLNIRVSFIRFDKSILVEVFSYSFYIFLGVIVDKINWSVDQFILGSFVGTIAVSVYAIASQINNIYMSFSTAISSVLLPKISKMITNNASDKEISDEFIKTGRIQYILLMLILTGFIIFGKDFINLWAGPEYNLSYYIALILTIPLTIPIIQNIGINILQAKNKVRFRSIIYILIAVLNILISISLVRLYSGVGVAIGTAISLILGNIIIMNIYYYKVIHIDIPKFWKEIFKIFVPIFLLATISFYIINVAIIVSTTYKLIVFIPIYSLIYIFLVYKFIINEYEAKIFVKPLNNIMRKFFRKG